MAEATSAGTRALIRQATATGEEADRAVGRYRSDARTALAAFDADVNALRLNDRDYDHASRTSGLTAMLAIGDRIASRADPRSD